MAEVMGMSPFLGKSVYELMQRSGPLLLFARRRAIEVGFEDVSRLHGRQVLGMSAIWHKVMATDQRTFFHTVFDEQLGLLRVPSRE